MIERLVLCAMPTLLLQGGHHAGAVAVAGAACKHFHAALGGTPLDDLNLHHAAPPLAHQSACRLVNINRTGAYKSAAVVIYLVDVGLTLDFETGAEGIYRPICSSAAHLVIVFQPGTHSIARPIGNVVALRVGVSRCAYHTVELFGVVERHAVFIPPQIREPGIGASRRGRSCRHDEA